MTGALLRNAELEAVILADPLEPDGWLVYGDWLQSQGDPRGELVAVQARLARDPGNAALMEAQRTLFALHGEALLEGLSAYLVATEESGPLFRLAWEFGFLWTASIRPSLRGGDAMADALRTLLHHPSAQFLHALSIGTPPESAWASVLAALSEADARSLRILFLGEEAIGNPRPAFGALGDLSGLWQTVPHLQVLALRGGPARVGDLELPELRELTIETSALQRETLAALGARTWPDLEKLELWFGDRRCTCALPDLEPLLDATRFPRLRHLAFRNCAFVDRICHSIVASRLVRQLHVLDLSLGALTDNGGAALLAGRDALRGLAVLDLRHNSLRETAMPIKTLAPFVDLSSLGRAQVGGVGSVWMDA